MLTLAQVYWAQVDWALKPDTGAGVVQCITIPEARKSPPLSLLFLPPSVVHMFHGNFASVVFPSVFHTALSGYFGLSDTSMGISAPTHSPHGLAGSK